MVTSFAYIVTSVTDDQCLCGGDTLDRGSVLYRPVSFLARYAGLPGKVMPRGHSGHTWISENHGGGYLCRH